MCLWTNDGFSRCPVQVRYVCIVFVCFHTYTTAENMFVYVVYVDCVGINV